MLRGSLSCDWGGGREGLLACLRHFRRVIAWFTSNRLWPSNHVLHTHMHTRTHWHAHTHTLTLHTVCAITESQQELDTIMGAKRAFNLTWLTLGKQLDQEPLPTLPLVRSGLTGFGRPVCGNGMIKSSMQQPQAARKRIKSMKVATAPRFALHWFQAEGDPRLELWPLAQLRQQSQWSWSWSWSQSQCRTLVALLKAFSFHSLYFASFGSCEFMKMKIAKKLQNSSSWSYSHCVIFPLLPFFLSVFFALLTLLHSAQWLIEPWRRATAHNIYRTSNLVVEVAATALGSLNICMLDLMWIQIAYQLLNCWKQNRTSSQGLVEQMPYIRRNF